MASLIDDNAADGNLGKGNIRLIKLDYTRLNRKKMQQYATLIQDICSVIKVVFNFCFIALIKFSKADISFCVRPDKSISCLYSSPKR